MKKSKLISHFFEDDDLIFIGCDDSDQHLLNKAYGGAKQSDLSLKDLIQDIPESASENPPAHIGAVTPSSTPVEEPPQKKSVFNPEKKLFEHLSDSHSIRKFGNLPYIRRGYVWLPVSEEVIGALLMESLSDEKSDIFQSGLADRVAKRIMYAYKFKEDSLVLPKHAVLFRNGVYDIMSQERIDTPPDNWFFPFAIHCDFTPDCRSECPVFDRFISQISNHDPETEELFMTFLAYCLMPGAQLKRLFVLGPEHDTGKSLLIEWLQHYIGEEQTTNIPLEKYHQNFTLADIVGKSIAFSPELPSDPLPSKATIVAKNITGHDKIQIQQKYLKAFKYLPHAKIICGTNHPIRSNDLPFWRRILVLPCLNPIPPNMQDDELLEKLFAEEDAIMVKIMNAAREFVLNGMEFPYCAASLEVKLDWQRNNVPNLARFIEERCILDPNARSWSEDLHDAFADYCSVRGCSVPSVRAFVDAIKIGWPELPHDRWSENGRQGRGFYGIKLLK